MSPARQGHPRWTGYGEDFWQNIVPWRRKWQQTPVILPRHHYGLHEKAKVWNEKMSSLGQVRSGQFSSVAQSCLILCDPMNCSTPGLPVHHQLPEFNQTHVHQVGDTIQPSHPLLSPSPPSPNPSQHQGLFQWVNSSHEVAKSEGVWYVIRETKIMAQRLKCLPAIWET